MASPTIYVNVHDNHGRLEAHDMVHTCPHAAARAAEDYADTYAFTLTDVGKTDLTDLFSEGWHEKRDADAGIDARIDDLKELSSFTMTARR
jgi:hypothetical protein